MKIYRPDGCWIPEDVTSRIDDMTSLHYQTYRCSECSVYVEHPSNFCPECGADMRNCLIMRGRNTETCP